MQPITIEQTDRDQSKAKRVLPVEGYYSDRERLARGVYYVCAWNDEAIVGKNRAATSRIPFKPGDTVYLNRNFKKIGTVGIVENFNTHTYHIEWVGVDFDNKARDEAGALSIREAAERLKPYPWVELRYSTSGYGLHAVVMVNDDGQAFDTRVPHSYGEEYAVVRKGFDPAADIYMDLKKRVESYIRDIVKDTAPIDTTGGTNALYHYTDAVASPRVKPEGEPEDGPPLGLPFELIKAATGTLDVSKLAAAVVQPTGRSASQRPRTAPGLPPGAPAKMLKFIESLPSWLPADDLERIVGHFHLAHLRDAMLAANIPGYCDCRTAGSNLAEPNAYLTYRGDGFAVHDYVIHAMNGRQPCWSEDEQPRLVLGTVTLEQLAHLGVTPPSGQLNGKLEIKDATDWKELERGLALHSMTEYDPELEPFRVAQRGEDKCPVLEWRNDGITFRHAIGRATAERLSVVSGGFWTATTRGVSVMVRFAGGQGVQPRSKEVVAITPELETKLLEHFAMIHPSHVNNGQRPDTLYCAPYYVRERLEQPWEPLTTLAELNATLCSVLDLNLRSTARARRVLSRAMYKYVTHSYIAALGPVANRASYWNLPPNTLANTRPNVELLAEMSGGKTREVRADDGSTSRVPFLVWWYNERLKSAATVLPTIFFRSSITCSRFRDAINAAYIYPCVTQITPTARLSASTIPARTLVLCTPRLTDEIPHALDRRVEIRDSAGPTINYSVIVSGVAAGAEDEYTVTI